MPSNQPMKRTHLLPTSIACAMDSENERAGPLPNNGMHLTALRAAADANRYADVLHAELVKCRLALTLGGKLCFANGLL